VSTFQKPFIKHKEQKMRTHRIAAMGGDGIGPEVVAVSRASVAQDLQLAIMGYLPGFATPRIVCDVPYVGKRWVHQVVRYDRNLGISYWTKNYRTGLDGSDVDALNRVYPFYDPIDTLPASGQAWWRENSHLPCDAALSVGCDSELPA